MTSTTTAAERLQRLLAVRIGAERAVASAKSILGAPGFETAEGRLAAEIEGDDDEADVGTMAATAAVVPVVALVSVNTTEVALQTEPAAAPRRRKDADIEARARQEELPPPPDFSAATHALFRVNLEGLVVLAEQGYFDGLRAVVIKTVSSSPKAMARYRDLAVTAIEAREGRA